MFMNIFGSHHQKPAIAPPPDIAEVSEEIVYPHRGRVKFKGRYFHATCPKNVTIHVGELVKLLSHEEDSLTLIVEPL